MSLSRIAVAVACATGLSVFAAPDSPSSPEKIRAWLRTLARHPPDTPPWQEAYQVLDRAAEGKAAEPIHLEWRHAVRDDALKLPPPQRANLWDALIRHHAEIRRRDEDVIQDELQAFHKALPKDPAFHRILTIMLRWERTRGNPENVAKYLNAYRDALSAKDIEPYESFLKRFRAGASPPELKGKDWDGRAVDLQTFRGRPVLIYFWSSG